ncbi:MAG: glutamate racemase [Succinivibrio sp.]
MSAQKVKVKRVLFFDSGVGGLSVIKAVRALNPDIESYYLFDNECFPYGNKSDDFLIRRVDSLIERACRQFELSAIVVACNTASTVALPELRDNISIPIVGVVPAIKPAALVSKNKILGLLATPGTISREYTKNLISSFASDCQVIKVGDPELAVIAEERLSTGHVNRQDIKKILAPFMDQDFSKRPDTIVLGCTHYPFVKDVIANILPDVRLVDSGEAIGRRVKTVIKGSRNIEVENVHDRAFYTGTLNNYSDRLKMVREFGFSDLEKFE